MVTRILFDTDICRRMYGGDVEGGHFRSITLFSYVNVLFVNNVCCLYTDPLAPLP